MHRKIDDQTYYDFKTKLIVDKTSNYKINISYPEIFSSDSKMQKNFNQRIKQFIDGNISYFKKNLPVVTQADLKDFPKEMQQNILSISYSSFVSDAPQMKLVSINFKVKSLHYGRLTPASKNIIFNFNLTEDKPVQLAELFKDDYPYLRVIADYCKQDLAKRLAPGMPWLTWQSDSIAPKQNNYQSWTLQPRGILFVFSKEQLEPYSATGETVLVPFSIINEGLLLDWDNIEVAKVN